MAELLRELSMNCAFETPEWLSPAVRATTATGSTLER